MTCVILYVLCLLWIVFVCDDEMFWGGSFPALYSTGDKVTDLRNLIPADYNCCIHEGYDIYSNWLCFLDHQVVSACSAWFAEQFRDPRSPFWRVGPPRLAWPMWSHKGIWVYTPTISCHVILAYKHITNVGSCPMYQTEGKDIKHALFSCSRVREVWSTPGVWNHIERLRRVDRLGSIVIPRTYLEWRIGKGPQ
jgi:hypothetical protein